MFGIQSTEKKRFGSNLSDRTKGSFEVIYSSLGKITEVPRTHHSSQNCRLSLKLIPRQDEDFLPLLPIIHLEKKVNLTLEITILGLHGQWYRECCTCPDSLVSVVGLSSSQSLSQNYSARTRSQVRCEGSMSTVFKGEVSNSIKSTKVIESCFSQV